jgi:glutathionylspermidine synthase
MKRHPIEPRSNWQSRVESRGFIWHSLDNPYWDESAYYEFSAKEIDELEAVANSLHSICLEAVQHVIDHNRFAELSIPESFANLIRETWEAEPPAIYGRFDFAYNGDDPPVLLEYNADTPTALFEAAVVQWYWLQDLFPNADQFNSIHERLTAKWQELKSYVTEPLYFASGDSIEDQMTTSYLRDVAEQAGLMCSSLRMSRIGWDSRQECFVDLEERPIKSIFKLYPWEWMWKEAFGAHLNSSVQWIEPAWKAVLSNKGILPILWELYPHHPNLLEAYRDGPRSLREYVRKPLLSREGANVEVRTIDWRETSTGDYGEEGYIYQQFVDQRSFDGNYPVVGSWIIDGESGGMGIRESRTRITDNVSRFVPHLFR